MPARCFHVVMALAVLTTVGGCYVPLSSTHKGARPGAAKTNKTTRAQILEKFKQPAAATFDGRFFLYHYRQTKRGMVLPLGDTLSINYGTLLLEFDADNVVRRRQIFACEIPGLCPSLCEILEPLVEAELATSYCRALVIAESGHLAAKHGDVYELLVKVREQRLADLELWRKHAVSITERHEKSARRGSRRKTTTTVYRRTPGPAGPELRVLAINGRTPSSAASKKRERGLAKDERRIWGRREESDPAQNRLDLILRKLPLTAIRHEEIDGRSVLKLNFARQRGSPKPGKMNPGPFPRHAYATIWITEDGYHVIRAIVRESDSRSAGSLVIDFRPVLGAWLPHKSVVKSRSLRNYRELITTYDDYARTY